MRPYPARLAPATHNLALDEAAHAYEIFQRKEDGAIKIVLKP